MNRQLGIFYVDAKFFHKLNIKRGEGLNLFHGMIILRAEHDWYTDKVKYLGTHADFEELPQNIVIPEYKPVFAENPDEYGYNYGIPKWVRV